MASLEKRAKDSRQQVSIANINSNVALFSLNLKVLQLEKFTNGIREIVNFELGEEMEKYVFCPIMSKGK